MTEAFLVLGFLAGLAFVGFGWRAAWLRQHSLERMSEFDPSSQPVAGSGIEPRPFVHRYLVWPWILGLTFGLLLYFFTPVGKYFAPVFGLMLALALDRADSWRVARRTLLVEQQLAGVLDLLIGALQAGSGVLAALEVVVDESKQPIKAQLGEVLGRVRFGDNPQTVLDQLVARVPLETFQLFAQTLSVHWEVGGSLSAPLASVARTIRDRVELSRRLHAMTMQSRITILIVMGVTYFIGLLMWRNDPVRMEDFIRAEMGQAMLAACLGMQALGVAWVSMISRVRF